MSYERQAGGARGDASSRAGPVGRASTRDADVRGTAQGSRGVFDASSSDDEDRLHQPGAARGDQADSRQSAPSPLLRDSFVLSDDALISPGQRRSPRTRVDVSEGRVPPVPDSAPRRRVASDRGSPDLAELERLKQELASEKRARLGEEHAAEKLRAEIVQVKATVLEQLKIQREEEKRARRAAERATADLRVELARIAQPERPRERRTTEQDDRGPAAISPLVSSHQSRRLSDSSAASSSDDTPRLAPVRSTRAYSPDLSELERLKQELESERRARLAQERVAEELRAEIARVGAAALERAMTELEREKRARLADREELRAEIAQVVQQDRQRELQRAREAANMEAAATRAQLDELTQKEALARRAVEEALREARGVLDQELRTHHGYNHSELQHEHTYVEDFKSRWDTKFDHFHPCDLVAARVYTNENHQPKPVYKTMNEILRNVTEPDKPPDRIKSMYYHLKNAVTHLEGNLEGQRIYRGQSSLIYGLEDPSKYDEGKTVTWFDFKSTTTDQATAIRFAEQDKGLGTGVLFEIVELKANLGADFVLASGGAGVSQQQQLSHFPREAEILLPPGVSFKVTSRRQDGQREVVRLKFQGVWAVDQSEEEAVAFRKLQDARKAATEAEAERDIAAKQLKAMEETTRKRLEEMKQANMATTERIDATVKKAMAQMQSVEDSIDPRSIDPEPEPEPELDADTHQEPDSTERTIGLMINHLEAKMHTLLNSQQGELERRVWDKLEGTLLTSARTNADLSTFGAESEQDIEVGPEPGPDPGLGPDLEQETALTMTPQYGRPVVVDFQQRGSLGMALTRTSNGVAVLNVKPQSQASHHPEIRAGQIIVEVGSTRVQGMSYEQVTEMIAAYTERPLRMVLSEPITPAQAVKRNSTAGLRLQVFHHIAQFLSKLGNGSEIDWFHLHARGNDHWKQSGGDSPTARIYTSDAFNLMYASQFQAAVRSIGLSLTMDEASTVLRACTGGTQPDQHDVAAIDVVSFIEQVRDAQGLLQVAGFTDEELLRRRQAENKAAARHRRSPRSPGRWGRTSPPPTESRTHGVESPRSPDRRSPVWPCNRCIPLRAANQRFPNLASFIAIVYRAPVDILYNFCVTPVVCDAGITMPLPSPSCICPIRPDSKSSPEIAFKPVPFTEYGQADVAFTKPHKMKLASCNAKKQR